MDSQYFDDITKGLAIGLSRRQIIRNLLGGLVGVAGAGFAARVVRAQNAGDSCDADADCTSGICIDSTCLNCNPDDDTGCANGETCVVDQDNPVGVCQPVDRCADVTCEVCEKCDPDSGLCVSDCGQDLETCCEADQTCNEETGVCEGGTVDLCADVTCDVCERCDPSNGDCVSTCPACQVCSDGACVDDCDTCRVCNIDTGVCDFDCTQDQETCCGSDETCNADTGVCEPTVVACADDADCAPCQFCTDGACTPRCSECESCDTSSDPAGACFHDCRIPGTACACGDGKTCNEETGACESADGECATQLDCNPCYGCFDGVCVWLCGEACSACDEASGTYGTCLFDCRAGEGNSCCNGGQVCNQQTGQCEFDQSQFGTLVIKTVDGEGNLLTSACYDLFTIQTGVVQTSQPHCDGGFGDFDGANDGTVLFLNNVRGQLGVRETIPPPGYVAAADQFPTVGAGETVTITFVNTPIESGGEESGGEETGSEGGTATALPTTGTGQSHAADTWLTRIAFVGAAAALLGGKKVRDGQQE